MTDNLPIRTEEIADEDPATGFSCGKHELDRFFAKHALPNHQRGLGKTFVLRAPGDADLPAILGFYTLSMASEDPSALPVDEQRALPRYRAPVALIGRLAVDQRARGRGFGETLLVDALSRILQAASEIGCIGVIVDAKDDQAEGFYAKYGFTGLSTGSKPRRMYIPMATVKDALSKG